MNKSTNNPLIEDYLIYDETIRGLSELTVTSYRTDLYEFLRYLKNYLAGEPNTLAESIKDVTEKELSAVTLPILYSYLNYAHKTRDNSDTTRRRKISSIKGFYHYLLTKKKVITYDPTAELEKPKIEKREIHYLEFDECVDLLRNIQGRHAVRDRAIITIFLNCGLRLSELTHIKLTDIKGDQLRIIGKGDKERIVYLNDSCMITYQEYLKVRDTDSPYLFISGQNKPISNRSVERLVKKHLTQAGLDTEKISTHKLRHTAATLLFQNGVDVRTIQSILGHSSIATTQIYTHVNQQMMKSAVEEHPLNVAFKVDK